MSFFPRVLPRIAGSEQKLTRFFSFPKHCQELSGPPLDVGSNQEVSNNRHRICPRIQDGSRILRCDSAYGNYRFGGQPPDLVYQIQPDHRIRVLLARGRKDRTYSNVVYLQCRRPHGLLPIVSGISDKPSAAEKSAGLVRRQVILAQMNAIGSAERGYIGAIVHEENSALPVDCLRENAAFLEIRPPESVFVAVLNHFDARAQDRRQDSSRREIKAN